MRRDSPLPVPPATVAPSDATLPAKRKVGRPRKVQLFSGTALADRRAASVEQLVVKPRRAREMLDIGKTKYFELVKAGIIETVLIGGSRMPTMRGIERLLADAGSPPTDQKHVGPRKVPSPEAIPNAATTAATTAVRTPAN